LKPINKLKAVAVDNGKEPVLPSRQTVEKVSINLSHLYLSMSMPSLLKPNQLSKGFVDFYIEKAPTLVTSVGYVPLPLKATISIMFTSTEARWEQYLLGKLS